MTFWRRMCTTCCAATSPGTANETAVKSPAGAGRHRMMARIGLPPARNRSSSLNDPVAARAALTAFLRGVERRGVVFAQWQGGDAAAGDAALADTLRAFAAGAQAMPFAEWPRRFWAMLLAAPQLRGTP